MYLRKNYEKLNSTAKFRAIQFKVLPTLSWVNTQQASLLSNLQITYTNDKNGNIGH